MDGEESRIDLSNQKFGEHISCTARRLGCGWLNSMESRCIDAEVHQARFESDISESSFSGQVGERATQAILCVVDAPKR